MEDPGRHDWVSYADGPQTVRARVRSPGVRWLPRERLDRRLPEVWGHPSTLVVAPAGSGKTTLLAEWSAAAVAAGDTAAWYRVESSDGSPEVFLSYLRASIAHARAANGLAVDALQEAWPDAEVAAASLERLDGVRLLLVLDDLHAIAGSPAEHLLGRLMEYLPPTVHLVAGARSLPTFDVSRRRVSGELLEITGDDLRFRAWEIEGLFRDFYGESLRPDELTRLARGTEGWAAGLQLFHLATRDKSPGERRNLLEGLGRSSSLVREYLARNVLDILPPELRRFLVDTCVLRRVSAPLCDALRGASGSARLLEELERRQVFTVRVDDAGTYRYHEVLRSHLEGVLVDERGEEGARQLAMRAGALLEREGAVSDALAAYCRASAWDAVGRVLGAGGDRLTGGWSWLDAVPEGILRQDPWLMLATARRLRSDGQWARAVDMYRQAEAAFGAADAGDAARAERLLLTAFLEAAPPPLNGWVGGLRTAIHGHPQRRTSTRREDRRLRDDAGEVERLGIRLSAALGELAAGRVLGVPAVIQPIIDEVPAADVAGVAAWLAIGAARILGGDVRGLRDIEAGIAAADSASESWLARLGRVLTILADPAPSPLAWSELHEMQATAERNHDAWGMLLAELVEGWALLDSVPDSTRASGRAPGDTVELLDAAAARARRMGATALESWARSLAALACARAGAADARDRAAQAESLARTAGVTAGRYIAHLALARSEPSRATEHLESAEAARAQAGLRALRGEEEGGARSPSDWSTPGSRATVPGAFVATAGAGRGTAAGSAPTWASGPGSPGDPGPDPAPVVEIRLFGGFALFVRGVLTELPSLKPRPRALLRLLAATGGKPVHREALAAAFWPDADPETAAHNLNVALSSLRRELTDAAGGDDPITLVREGDAYRLALPPGGRVDLAELERALVEARAARARGDARAAARRYEAALAAAGGELLPEDGPSEWAVQRREEVRRELADAALGLAELLLDGDPQAAARACEAGIRIDPYHDPLWRMLIVGRERAGDHAAAQAARLGYEKLLARLGVETGASGPGPSGPESHGRGGASAAPGNARARATRSTRVSAAPGIRPP